MVNTEDCQIRDKGQVKEQLCRVRFTPVFEKQAPWVRPSSIVLRIDACPFLVGLIQSNCTRILRRNSR